MNSKKSEVKTKQPSTKNGDNKNQIQLEKEGRQQKMENILEKQGKERHLGKGNKKSK